MGDEPRSFSSIRSRTDNYHDRLFAHSAFVLPLELNPSVTFVFSNQYQFRSPLNPSPLPSHFGSTLFHHRSPWLFISSPLLAVVHLAKLLSFQTYPLRSFLFTFPYPRIHTKYPSIYIPSHAHSPWLWSLARLLFHFFVFCVKFAHDLSL